MALSLGTPPAQENAQPLTGPPPSSPSLVISLHWSFLPFPLVGPFPLAGPLAGDMGCHIDGFIAVVGHTHVIQVGPIAGRKVDVIATANTVAAVALRLVRLGNRRIHGDPQRKVLPKLRAIMWQKSFSLSACDWQNTSYRSYILQKP